MIEEGSMSRGTHAIQYVLGALCYLFVTLPFVRSVSGLDTLVENRRWLFVSNHVSLLDTLLIGGLFWARGRLPLLVLGDKQVWHRTWIRRALSARVGFLIDRRRPMRGRIGELERFAASHRQFQLLMFPEGTRGNGRTVNPFRPGIYHVAHAAELPIVPIFLENMHRVSSKPRGFRPLQGLRQVSIHIGQPIERDRWERLDRGELTRQLRRWVQRLVPEPNHASNADVVTATLVEASVEKAERSA